MKIALITGASTGIGRTVALELSQNGFEVLLVARNASKLEEVHTLIEQDGGKSQIFIADLSSISEVNQLIELVKRKTTDLSLIANIAGIWHNDVEAYSEKDFETFEQKTVIDTLNVGIMAPTLLIQGLLPLMKSRSKIINLSGTFENGAKGWVPYFVSKRAIEDLTIGLSQELEAKDIQVNCISPSDTATDAYARFFPQYMDEALDPTLIAKKFVELSDPENKTTGKIIVMKKNQETFEQFHY